jgi:hypothetical protein
LAGWLARGPRASPQWLIPRIASSDDEEPIAACPFYGVPVGGKEQTIKLFIMDVARRFGKTKNWLGWQYT